MSKQNVLVIVDVQDSFYELEGRTFAKIRNNVLNAINAAKANGDFVLTVLYDSHGKASYFVREALRGYSKKANVTKADDDGSKEIREKLNKLGIRPKNIIVCGINTTFCVFGTVYGLSRRGYKVKLLSEACANVNGYMTEEQRIERHNRSIESMRNMKNVLVV